MKITNRIEKLTARKQKLEDQRERAKSNIAAINKEIHRLRQLARLSRSTLPTDTVTASDTPSQ